jgi:hypothetical protein
MTVLNLRAGQDHLEKVASTRDPIKALAEFVWNAVDAEATRVSVEFVLNALPPPAVLRSADGPRRRPNPHIARNV